MKASELRALSDADLQKRLMDARHELFNLRFQLATRQLPSASGSMPPRRPGRPTGETAVEGRKRELVGRVVSDRMEKTVVVAVQRLRRHRLYQRTMRRTKKYMAHDEQNEAKVGDLVRIQESRPISRHKHWRLTLILERAAERGKAVSLPAAALPAEVPDVAVIASADLPSEVLAERESEGAR
jgi:small subunit ribosomal protein S17